MLTLLSLASGFLIHVSVFKHGEWDTSSPTIVLCYLGAGLGGALWLTSRSLAAANGVLNIAPTEFLRLLFTHLVGLFFSIAIYRIYLHRLSNFQGPVIARLSNFYLTWLSAKKLQLHEEIDILHSRYGDYVRTGDASQSLIHAPNCHSGIS